MKKALLLLLLASGLANAQSLQLQGGTGVPGSGYTNTIRSGAGAPGFLIGNNGDFYIDTTAHVLYGPKAAGVWPTPGISLGGGGGSPIWGAITGMLVNQTDLQSAIDAKQDVGSYLTALTGDALAAGPGSAGLTLATVNGAPGACGDSTHVCAVTTNGKGLVTSQSAVSVSSSAGLTSNSGLTATYNATTSDSFVDCFGTVNLPASPIADETISIYNVNSSACTVSAGSNFMDNGTGTGDSRSVASHATIRLHWDSVNTRWRFDQGFVLSFDALTSPTVDFTLNLTHAISFVTLLGGSVSFVGGPVNKTLNVVFQNGGGDDATTNKTVQWLDSSGSLLGYVDGSGNASFNSVAGAQWGSIGGSLSSQTDLAATLITKLADPGSNGLVYRNGAGGSASSAVVSGDVSIPSGSLTATLATVNAGPGVCGDASHVCQPTTNGKGLVTSQSAVAIAIASGAVSGLAASATTDATNASNISSGTLAAARVATLNQSTTGNAATATAMPASGLSAGTVAAAVNVGSGGSISVTGTGTVQATNLPDISGSCNSTIGTGNGTTYTLWPYAEGTGGGNPCNISNALEAPMTHACTFANLYVTAANAGAVVGSGVVTLYTAGNPRAVTCTLGTGTSCNDTTHTFSIAAGGTYSLRVKTGQASDTTSYVRAAIQCQ